MPDDKEIASINDGLAEAMASIPDEPLEREGEREPVAERAESPAPPPDDGTRRDERGRFAPKEQDAPATSAEEEREGGQIPSWRLREIREERDRMNARAEAAEQRAAHLEQQWRAMQQQQAYEAQQQQFQAPDPINDPNGYYGHLRGLIQQEAQLVAEANRNNWVNLTFATEEEKDPETFSKAFKTLERSGQPQAADAIRRSVNPGKALMSWYRQHTVMTEIGADPDGWRKSERERMKKDPNFRKEIWADLQAEARGNGNGQSFESNVSNLPSVNRAPGGAGRQQLGSLGNSDREIFENLVRKR